MILLLSTFYLADGMFLKKVATRIEHLTSRLKGNLHDHCVVAQWSEKIDSVPFFKSVPKLILSFGLIFLSASV